MKFLQATLLCLPALVAAVPVDGAVPTKTLVQRADLCGQWDSAVTGQYTVYQDLWGEAQATSGSQCTTVDSLTASTIAWTTKWSWAGAPNQVKSFANVALKMNSTKLSAINSITTAWKWTYTGTNLVADVAYDLFTSSTATSGATAEYEIMVWLSAKGGAGPISSGTPLATGITAAGRTWNLHYGSNGVQKVYSFVAGEDVTDFSGDLMDFFKYLIKSQNFSNAQYLQSVQAGTEPFTGQTAVLKTTAYSVALK